VVGEVGLMCDLHCAGGVISCGTAPGVEKDPMLLICKVFFWVVIRDTS
jgi:hypothetical protein